MKKITKSLLGIFLLAVTLHSCSTESEENPAASQELEQELALENGGVLKIQSATYIFKNTGETAKFISQDRDFNFKFVNELSFEANQQNKHAVEGLKITNPETEEYLIFSHFEELKNGFVKFDAELSTGEVLRSVMYKTGNSNASSNKWHDEPVIGVTTPVIGAMIEFSQEEQLRNCRAALQVCANTNGVPTVALTNGKGWFTSIESCALECHD
ncbi:hypothetical protein APR41_03555 [Salegentibacter salinarum]|uniref:Lipoprotein n=1 Tax=Salegentibacter salinarum TaxID=447422 RepID=A0A2N0TU88_9FLAO|nr:hypothetical protein [Salegentibacter salinarum]PKD18238.1 hypothetical protein APR41_03555 [Salegentibacter salinarum]SKB43241.1 hypothetical protein SAMN05660903_00724 [Salegentibacter salinarum]